MTSGELVRKMLMAHAQGDEHAFRLAARAYIQEEHGKKHHILADELERALNLSPPKSFAVLPTEAPRSNGAPKDKARDAFLVELLAPRRSLESLVLGNRTRASLQRLL